MRYYVLVTLIDNSHVEAEFSTMEEVNKFLDKYRDKLIPYETEIIDRKKASSQKNQESLGWVVMIFIGLFTLYFIFK